MTSSTAVTSNLPARRVPSAGLAVASLARRPRRRHEGAFTLVEMLVVSGIIVSLLAVLLPTVGIAWRKGVRTRMQLDLAAIATGLESYKSDHNSYPIVYGANSDPVLLGSVPQTGAAVLGRCMIGPGVDDGSDPVAGSAVSPGFRTRPKINGVQQGTLYGPYVPPERFRTGSSYELLDRNRKPIMYYPGRSTANIAVVAQGYLREATYTTGGGLPMFNGNDNKSIMPTADLQMVLGDLNKSGTIDGDEGAAFVGSYLLWSAGPDEKYGAAKDRNKPISTANRCDDVANFDRNEY